MKKKEEKELQNEELGKAIGRKTALINKTINKKSFKVLDERTKSTFFAKIGKGIAKRAKGK